MKVFLKKLSFVGFPGTTRFRRKSNAPSFFYLLGLLKERSTASVLAEEFTLILFGGIFFEDIEVFVDNSFGFWAGHELKAEEWITHWGLKATLEVQRKRTKKWQRKSGTSFTRNLGPQRILHESTQMKSFQERWFFLFSENNLWKTFLGCNWDKTCDLKDCIW